MSEAVTESIEMLKPKDYASDQEIRWCPGCGDYSILKQVQTVLADIQASRENTVFVSGIGCSSRYPYYMNTYGMHSIHGRAPAIASGLKTANPELDVWIVTGDGDALSIGGNHLIHLLRRNFDVNVLLFNNEIYGLTKGQYSPTSPLGKVSNTTPLGSLDFPFNPLALAIGAEGTFIARGIDRNPKHLRTLITEARAHKGTSLLEIYQDCNVFNSESFGVYTDKATKEDAALYLEEGQPLRFGAEQSKGIKLDGFKPMVIELTDHAIDECWVHDPTDKVKASILSQFFNYQGHDDELPRPFGVFYREDRFNYEDQLKEQLSQAKEKMGKGSLDQLLSGPNPWTIE